MRGNNGIIRPIVWELSTIALAFLACDLSAKETKGDEPPTRWTRVRLVNPQLAQPESEFEPIEREVLPRGAGQVASQNLQDRLKPISEVVPSLGSRPADYPQDLSENRPRQILGWGRDWANRVHSWEATAFCHRPLYFEDENLERYGRSFGIAQPFVSSAHFAGRVLAWPYLLVAVPTHRCICIPGREPPGSCAPYRLQRPPLPFGGICSGQDPQQDSWECDADFAAEEADFATEAD